MNPEKKLQLDVHHSKDNCHIFSARIWLFLKGSSMYDLFHLFLVIRMKLKSWVIMCDRRHLISSVVLLIIFPNVTLNNTDRVIQPHKMVLRMLVRGTVRNGRKNGISIQSEVFGIQIGAGNENFIANGLHWYDEWITLIKWNSAFEPKVIYCFFFCCYCWDPSRINSLSASSTGLWNRTLFAT